MIPVQDVDYGKGYRLAALKAEFSKTPLRSLKGSEAVSLKKPNPRPAVWLNPFRAVEQ
jgi:hypothetical protein